MAEDKNLDKVIGTFKDGDLTGREYKQLMGSLQQKGGYLPNKEHDRLVALAEQEGIEVLTKYQFVQCRESAIFRMTGVTRE